MKCCLLGCALLLLLALIAASLWLGWGRQRGWPTATGGAELTDPERAWMRHGAADYARQENSPVLEWFGHATMRIEWGGVRLVADPVNSTRLKVAPRLFAEPILQDSAALDAILLTHAHMDHMDNATLARLAPTRLYLPAGSERFLSAAAHTRHEVVPVQMDVPFQLGSLLVTAVTAIHGGWRYPWQDGLFACGYVIQHQGEALYLVGDTAMGDHFAAVGAQYAPRYVVLPIGAYSPEWFLRSRHLNPEEALDAAEALGSEYVVPYHFGTFRLSLEASGEPLRRWAAGALSRERKWYLPIGGEGM